MKLVSLAVICMLGACGVALAQSFAPARLVGLQGRDDLRCPTVDRQSPVLFCQVVIDAHGKARDDQSTHCFGNLANDLTRARDLRGKILKSEFAPAQIDGEPVEVYASFRVSFSPNGKACEISVYPNFGTQQDEFGLDYFAPQEIYTHGGWLGTIPQSEQRWLERPARGYDHGVVDSPLISPILRESFHGPPRRLNLTEDDKLTLEAFLLTLTDTELLSDPKFADPF
jgi:hypothetical protein